MSRHLTTARMGPGSSHANRGRKVSTVGRHQHHTRAIATQASDSVALTWECTKIHDTSGRRHATKSCPRPLSARYSGRHVTAGPAIGRS